jgi:hypothetical protein
LLYESALKTQKMNLKSAMACENTSISYRSKLYLKLVKHGLRTLVWLTVILFHSIRPFFCVIIFLEKKVHSFWSLFVVMIKNMFPFRNRRNGEELILFVEEGVTVFNSLWEVWVRVFWLTCFIIALWRLTSKYRIQMKFIYAIFFRES